MVPHGKKAPINIYICAAAGALIGWFMGGAMGNGNMTARIEAMAVGIFGAVGAGEFLSDVFSGAKPSPDFSLGKLVMALVGTGVMLALLGLMRKIVGPMREGKSSIQDRR